MRFQNRQLHAGHTEQCSTQIQAHNNKNTNTMLMTKRSGQQSASSEQQLQTMKMSPSLQLPVIQFALPHIVVLRVIVAIIVPENCLCTRIFRWLLELPISDIPYLVENIPISTGWTLNHFVIFGLLWQCNYSCLPSKLRTCKAGLQPLR